MAAQIELHEKPDVWVLQARGELDYADCEPFRRQIEHIVTEMPHACIVDLSRIEYLDSSGLGLLLRLYREYAGSGGRLVLIASATVDGILEITRLDDLFATAADMGTALESVRSSGHASA